MGRKQSTKEDEEFKTKRREEKRREEWLRFVFKEHPYPQLIREILLLQAIRYKVHALPPQTREVPPLLSGKRRTYGL